jgi:hypothetical protein
MMGYRAPVVEVFPHDIDGDGSTEVICGTGGGFVECLSAEGDLKWREEFFWGIPDHFRVAPAEDGSKHLIVDATARTCGSWTWRLDGKGEIVTKSAFDTGRGSWDSTRNVCTEVVDMDGAGMWLAIVGRGGAFNELGLYDAVSGERKWVQPMANIVTTVAAVDLDDDGVKEILAGSTSAWLCAFDINGESRWALQLPSEVVAVSSVGNGLMALCSDGNVYRLSAEGEYAGIYTPEATYPTTYRSGWQFQHTGATTFVGDKSGSVTVLSIQDTQ